MNIFLAMLLGLVQGLCEFLPVSSSGHLVLLQTIFGVEEGALFFTTMLHVGTLLAVFAVYWRQIWEMLRRPIQKKVGMLLLSTAVTTLLAFLFRDVISAAYEGILLGPGFLLTAAIHAKKALDTLIKLRFVVVEKEREIYQILLL